VTLELDAELELDPELEVELAELVVVCGLLVVVDVDSVTLKLQTNKQTNKQIENRQTLLYRFTF